MLCAPPSPTPNGMLISQTSMSMHGRHSSGHPLPHSSRVASSPNARSQIFDLGRLMRTVRQPRGASSAAALGALVP